MFVTIIIILIILLGIVVIRLIKQALNKEASSGKYEEITEIKREPQIKLKYHSGHPAINKRMNIYLLLNKSNIEICKFFALVNDYTDPLVVATIPLAAIKEIIIKDHSTTDYETSTSRMIRFGNLGLALKTKVLNEVADLLITWKQGNETHVTCFTKKGKDAIADITDVKNRLEKWRNHH